MSVEKLTTKTRRASADQVPPDKRKAQFFFVGPDNEIYKNRENYPAETLASLSRFRGNPDWVPFRFAFDSVSKKVYVQDDSWKGLINDHDESAWALLNAVSEFVREGFELDEELGLGYGEPPDTAQLRKLSQYGIAWRYISQYISSEFETNAIDVPVVEYSPAEPEGVAVPAGAKPAREKPVTFSKDGTQQGEVSVKGPVLLVNLKLARLPKLKGEPFGGDDLDYGRINQSLIMEYLTNLTSISPVQNGPDTPIDHGARWRKHMEEGGYELYFAIWGEDGPQVYKTNKEQKQRIQDERARQGEATTQGYEGPILFFAYIPVRNQIILQNRHPGDMSPMEKKMLVAIKEVMAANKGAKEEDLSIGFDNSDKSPFVTTISRYTMLWDYITEVLAPYVKFEPQDIPVIEMPISQNGGTIAAYSSNEKEEEDRVPGSEQFRLTRGINIPYPFILVDPRIRNLGEKYYAMLHEYVHHSQALRNSPLIHYSYKGSMNDAKDQEERTRRFVEYINNPNESEAHLNQMVYMLHMGIPANQVIDMFMPASAVKSDPKQFIIARAEYRKLLDKAIEIYERDMEELGKQRSKRKSPKDVGKPPKDVEAQASGRQTKQAALDISVNDWWYVGLQENINRSRHTNTKQDPQLSGQGTKPYNLREKRGKPAQVLSMEGMLSRKHDAELSSEKHTEQLLRESVI